MFAGRQNGRGAASQASARGQRHKAKPCDQGDQPDDTEAAFRLGQQLQQGAPHAAGKERPAKALDNDSQPKSAQKKSVIEFHGFLVTENRPFVKERIMAAHKALQNGMGMVRRGKPAATLCVFLRRGSANRRPQNS